MRACSRSPGRSRGGATASPQVREGRPPRHHGADPWYRVAAFVLAPPLKLWLNWDLEGLERIPSEGPMLLACNHISYFDAIALGYCMHVRGRRPRFLAKSELFRNPVLRTILSGAGQIPVERGTGDPAPLAAAASELDHGQVVIMFPEGTTTKDPEFRQQSSKTGIARLSLSTGTPVTPAVIWGVHRIWKNGNKIPAFGRPVTITIGEPLAFSEHAGSEDPDVLRKVTDDIMSTIERMWEEAKAAYPERWR